MLGKICGILNGIIIAVLLAGVLLLLGPRVIGGQNLAVLSGSMEPGIPVGSMVITKPTDPAKLQEGDVITYKISAETMVTHRIVSIDTENQTIVTKGDANETEDGEPVAFANVVGKVLFHVPLMGYLTIYIKTPIGIAVGCGIVIVLILLNFLPEIFTKEEKAKEEK